MFFAFGEDDERFFFHIQSIHFTSIPLGVLIDNSRLILNTADKLEDGPNDLSFEFEVHVNPTGGDAKGNNLWRVESYTSDHVDGTGTRNVIRTQVLDYGDASRDVTAGATVHFTNLAALIDSSESKCEREFYLCAELSKHTAASTDFKMKGTQENALSSCKLLRCAKARKFILRGENAGPNETLSFSFTPVANWL